jgi:AraC-like DNA-binding protein/mannose-6-phosphate isomerase-like protein (cupin superfamily)
MNEATGCVLPILCQQMSKIRHVPVATTASRPLRAGQRVGEHWHDEHQLVYASSGVLTVATEHGVWVAPPSRALWVPAGTRHEPHPYGTTVLVTIGLTPNPLRLSRPAVLAVAPLLREFLTPSASTPAEPGARRRRLLAVLLDQLTPTDSRPLHLPPPGDRRLVTVGELLDSGDARPMPQLAAAAGTSARTLARLCRGELGMTFPQWRTQIRLHLALRLLATGLPVTTVAHRCGWATPSAFIDVFRRTLGYTPGVSAPRRAPRSAGRSPRHG